MRFLKRLFVRGNPTPPLLSRERHRSTPPPPPPPAGRSGPKAPVAKAPGKRRRFRLIQGGGNDVETAETPEVAPSLDATETSSDEVSVAAEPTTVPAIHLVFSDGSSAPVESATPSGVRIRYLADNLLPPEDPASAR